MKASIVLEGLLAVKEAALASNTDATPIWFDSRHGICGNLDSYQINCQERVRDYTGYSSVQIQNFYKLWPEYSGCDTFPVPSVDEDYTEEEMYMEHRGSMWIKEYGAARLRLLDYLIEQMEKFGDEEV